MPNYQPTPAQKFTFGLWTIANPGRDPLGDAVRESPTPVEIVHLLAELGAYGVNFHDNDLVPIDATPAEQDKIVADFKRALNETGIVVPMATTNFFYDPVFRDGAFTSNDPEVRAYALQKTMRSMDLGAELGAKIYVVWSEGEGIATDLGKKALDADKWFREAMNFLCEYSMDQGYGYKFALEAKPNEPNQIHGDIYPPTMSTMLGFIATLDHPEMVGVKPEADHEIMVGPNFMHAVAQAYDAGKLFNITLNNQNISHYDQDFRFGSYNVKHNFFLVKFLEDVGYDGLRHFDAHAYRISDLDDIRVFVCGCMRTYMIFKEKAEQFRTDKEIQDLLADIATGKANALKTYFFDRAEMGQSEKSYEQLDQLVIDLLVGVQQADSWSPGKDIRQIRKTLFAWWWQVWSGIKHEFPVLVQFISVIAGVASSLFLAHHLLSRFHPIFLLNIAPIDNFFVILIVSFYRLPQVFAAVKRRKSETLVVWIARNFAEGIKWAVSPRARGCD